MRIFFILITVIFSVLLVVCIMFVFKICPPVGPWPDPPWCITPKRILYNVEVRPTHLTQIKSVNMFDTWGRNYNMGMFENTRDNIETSFARVKGLGAAEVFVHDFHMAKYAESYSPTSTDYTIVDETFWNDFRDESMDEKDLEELAKIAHANNLRIGINHNLHFLNIGKYMFEGGNIQDAVTEDYNQFKVGHTDTWTKDFFQKWKLRLIEKAKIYEEAKVDMINIYPGFMASNFAGQEELVNNLQKDLIREIRKVFSGKIVAEVSRYGFVEGKEGTEDWAKYDFYKDADIVQIRVYDLPQKYWSTDVEASMGKYVRDLDKIAKSKNIKLSIFFAPSSYKDSLQSEPIEFLDFLNEKVKSTNPDYEYQSRAYDSLFKAVSQTTNIERINVANFAWDDSMDPEVKPKISISTSFRNKPAENIIMEWFTK